MLELERESKGSHDTGHHTLASVCVCAQVTVSLGGGRGAVATFNVSLGRASLVANCVVRARLLPDSNEARANMRPPSDAGRATRKTKPCARSAPERKSTQPADSYLQTPNSACP